VPAPTTSRRRVVSASAALAATAATGWSSGFGSLEALRARQRCSYSTGGTSPSDSCKRLLLNQPTYSTVATSSCGRVRQTRSAISSVLKLSTNDSASALSYASPTDPTEASRPWSSSVCV